MKTPRFRLGTSRTLVFALTVMCAGGAATARAGNRDAHRDGFDELAIGNPDHPIDGVERAGAVQVLYGAAA